jgi:hypothetical protein
MEIVHRIGRAFAAPLNRVRAGGADRGASALEWAVIAAVLVVAASAIGFVVYGVVQDKGSALEQCANQPIGAQCGTGGGGGGGN